MCDPDGTPCADKIGQVAVHLVEDVPAMLNLSSDYTMILMIRQGGTMVTAVSGERVEEVLRSIAANVELLVADVRERRLLQQLRPVGHG